MMEIFWFCVVAYMLAMYVVLDGFDLGAGIVYLIIGRTDAERETIHRAIGPVWDGNEVWIIAAGGTIFSAFPLLYASSFSGFYLPLMIVLWLLILRGIAIEFRNHIQNPVWPPLWDAVFCFASLLLAVFYGAALGNVVRGVPLDDKGYFFVPLWTNFRLGPQPADTPPPPEKRSDGDWAFVGGQEERHGQLLVAWATYAEGLRRFPESFALGKAAGRLAVALKRYEEAVAHLTPVLARATNDPEIQYYLGLALAALGAEDEARTLWDGAQTLRAFRPAARLELSRSDARRGDLAAALERIQEVVEESPDSVRAGGFEVILLRRQGRRDEARKQLRHWHLEGLLPAVQVRQQHIAIGILLPAHVFHRGLHAARGAAH